jgi:hypothetical protein
VISPLGDAEEPSRVSGLTLRPEQAAYLQYTITPPTMFIGYQVQIDGCMVIHSFMTLTACWKPAGNKRSSDPESGKPAPVRCFSEPNFLI